MYQRVLTIDQLLSHTYVAMYVPHNFFEKGVIMVHINEYVRTILLPCTYAIQMMQSQ